MTVKESRQRVYITECPRDAMQGIGGFIPTENKISYLDALLDVGFDRLDFGSLVSPKAVPQMRDTVDVLEGLKSGSATQLLAIVANHRGAAEAVQFDRISYIGFPLSVSETFQQRNTNSGIDAAYKMVLEMLDMASGKGKELIVYLSMAFGNPYGEDWNSDIVGKLAERLYRSGIRHISLADTVGVASASDVRDITASVISSFPDLEVGIHLHCKPGNWREKVDAAFNSGCRYFDAAIRGYGGCPMAEDKLVGNLATENLLQYLNEKNVETLVQTDRFNIALQASHGIFLASA